MADIRIGVSGWTYEGWRGVFYPQGLGPRKELWYSSREFNSIEINGTFYRLQKLRSFDDWYHQTPRDFLFAVKGSQFITHILRVKGERLSAALAHFFASGVLYLREKLGPFLWQFPPSFALKDDRMETFIGMLPRTTGELIHWVKAQGLAAEVPIRKRPLNDMPLRHAFEFRHPSFLQEGFLEMLREKNIGLVISDTKNHGFFTEDLTADFVYLRLHGEGPKYVNGYTSADLDFWARRIRTWARGTQVREAVRVLKKDPPKTTRDVYLYFDNDWKALAPRNAKELMQKLRIRPPLG